RSNALSGGRYGAEFSYDEAVMSGPGLKGRATATAMALGLGGFVALAAIPPTRWLLEQYVVPKPGDGPSPAAQESGFYDIRFHGRTAA
ncbi:saccharopine dehydrogenase, partial [Acinetobacter baumannii]